MTIRDFKNEAEANHFANCLLMPKEMFIAEYEKVRDRTEEERVSMLSKIFEVPEWAVVHRISYLKEKIFYPQNK